jgi:hypothetical protein
MQELRERRLHAGEIAAVVLQVVRVDVGDDRDQRIQAQEAAIAFVGLGNQPLAIAQLGIVDLLLKDVAAAGTLSLETARFWHYLLVLLQLALWVYAVVSMTKTIEMQSLPKNEAEGSQPSRILKAGIQLDAATAKNVKPPLPDWSLL